MQPPTGKYYGPGGAGTDMPGPTLMEVRRKITPGMARGLTSALQAPGRSVMSVYHRQSQAFLESAGFVAAPSAGFLESAKPVSLSHRDTG